LKEHICWLCEKKEYSISDNENYTCESCREKCLKAAIDFQNNEHNSKENLEFTLNFVRTALLKFFDAEGSC